MPRSRSMRSPRTGNSRLGRPSLSPPLPPSLPHLYSHCIIISLYLCPAFLFSIFFSTSAAAGAAAAAADWLALLLLLLLLAPVRGKPPAASACPPTCLPFETQDFFSLLLFLFTYIYLLVACIRTLTLTRSNYTLYFTSPPLPLSLLPPSCLLPRRAA